MSADDREPGPQEPLSAEIEDPTASGEWADVRESWVDLESAAIALQPAAGRDVPPKARSGSVPPALPPAHLVSAMLERLAAGDYEGTLIAARAALKIHPTNDDALQCREMAARALRKLYVERLGMVAGARSVPRRVAKSARGLELHARRLLELVDGHATIEDIVDAGKPDPLDSLRMLSELALSNVIVVEHE